MGDPVPGGGWRGFGPLLHESLGGADAVHYANVSSLGARAACVRREQLPRVMAMAPDVAVVLVGMNDTLRSDFDSAQLALDYETVIGSLRAGGTTVLTVRFHDHSRVFWMPGPLRRALQQRIAELNAVIDAAVTRHDVDCLDLDLMPGGYDRETWSVDRLHPSELGHRMLADNFGRMLRERDFRMVVPVSLDSEGGREITAVHRVLWLVFKGLPWLTSRGHDLVRYALTILVREAWRAVSPHPGPRASRPRRSAS
jgi:lysophospholipase L1-like esterase